MGSIEKLIRVFPTQGFKQSGVDPERGLAGFS